MTSGASASDEDMKLWLLLLLRHGWSNLRSPAAVFADDGQLVPSEMHSLAMDVDENSHGNHGGDGAWSTVASQGQRQALFNGRAGHTHDSRALTASRVCAI